MFFFLNKFLFEKKEEEVNKSQLNDGGNKHDKDSRPEKSIFNLKKKTKKPQKAREWVSYACVNETLVNRTTIIFTARLKVIQRSNIHERLVAFFWSATHFPRGGLTEILQPPPPKKKAGEE